MKSASEVLAGIKAARAPPPPPPPPPAPGAPAAAAPPPPAAAASADTGRDRTPAEMEAFVAELLRENRGMRLTWSVAYFMIHFIIGSGALYLALLHVDTPFAGDAALLLPLARAGVSERAMLGALSALPLAMATAAYAAYARSTPVLAAAALALVWPSLVLLRALAGAPALRAWPPAWLALAVPPLVLAVQHFAEAQFVAQEKAVLAAFDAARATLARRAEAAEEAAAAAAAKAAVERGSAVRRNK